MTLAELVRALDPDSAPDGAVEVRVEDQGEGAEYLLLVGLLDALVGEALAGLPDAAARRATAEAIGGVEALAAVMRFELHGLRERLRQDELAARMREREIAVTEGWLLPRLRGDVAAYEARLEALRAALREP